MSDRREPPVEGMSEFFTARIDTYEEHMLESWREVYGLFADLLPAGAREILDLGCGTGLELDALFARRGDLRVTGVDCTRAMLDKLREKPYAAALELIEGDYFLVPLGEERFDAAVSFETLHHFPYEKKLGLYRRLFAAIRPGGVYLECDYMCDTRDQEDFFMSEAARLRREAGLPDDAYVHYDTPLTVDRQKELLARAGFASIEELYNDGGTVILRARKE